MFQEPHAAAMWDAPLDGASLDLGLGLDINNDFGLPGMGMEMGMVMVNENGIDCAWPALEQANWGMFDLDLDTVLAQTQAQGFSPSGSGSRAGALFDELANMPMPPSSTPVAPFGLKSEAVDTFFGDMGDALLRDPHQLQPQDEQRKPELLLTPNSLGLYGAPSFTPQRPGHSNASLDTGAVAPEAIFSAEDYQQYMSLARARACSTPPPAQPYGLAPSPYASTPALSPDSGLSSDSDCEAVTPCPVRVASSSSSLLASSPPLAAPAFFSPGPRPAIALPRSALCTPARKPRSRNTQTPRKKCASARKARKSAGSAFNFLRNNAAAGPSKTRAEDEDEEDDNDEEYTPGLKCYVCGYKQARIAGDRRSFRRHMETHDEFKKYVWRCIGLLRTFSFLLSPPPFFFSLLQHLWQLTQTLVQQSPMAHTQAGAARSSPGRTHCRGICAPAARIGTA